MPATIHHQLLQGANAALQALASVPPSRVHVERATPFDVADCPAVNLAPGAAKFDVFGAQRADGLGELRARLLLLVRVHTRASTHTAAADPVIGQVHAALMADPSLGGLCLSLTLAESAPQATPADGGTAGIWQLAYQATAIVDEATLAAVST